MCNTQTNNLFYYTFFRVIRGFQQFNVAHLLYFGLTKFCFGKRVENTISPDVQGDSAGCLLHSHLKSCSAAVSSVLPPVAGSHRTTTLLTEGSFIHRICGQSVLTLPKKKKKGLSWSIF